LNAKKTNTIQIASRALQEIQAKFEFHLKFLVNENLMFQRDAGCKRRCNVCDADGRLVRKVSKTC